MSAAVHRRYRFGPFELDPRSGELRSATGLLRLQEQSLQTLLLLLERPGDMVTRDELRRRLWPNDTFVDFEHGLHAIVSRLREALGDSSDAPIYIETLPRRGYRLLGPVEVVAGPAGPPGAATPATPASGSPLHAPSPSADTSTTPDVPGGFEAPTRRVGPHRLRVLAVLVGCIALGTLAAWPVGRWRGAAPARAARLAVLPFDNFTGDDDQQFFVDGLHEELTYRLGQMHPQQLAVIGRTSMLQYKGSSKTIAAIARELSVDFVLEGSVRRSAPRVRITAQLIRGSDQSHVWTESYERSWSDLLAIQKDIGARVAESLTVQLVPTYQAQMERDASVAPAAYEQYLRGRFLWNQRVRDPLPQLTRAIGHFDAALQIQPSYAVALVGVADAYNSLAFAGGAPATASHARARAAVERALQLDERLPSAHATLAWMMFNVDHDWPAAERAFIRALELDPGDARTRFRHAHLSAVRGRLDEAAREALAARQIDPLSSEIPKFQAFLAWYADDDQQARSYMREAADMEANSATYGAFSAFVDAARGDCEGARKELAQLLTAADDIPYTTEAAYALGRCGTDPTMVAAFREELVARRLWFPTAHVHLGRGELDGFYAWLDTAIAAQSPEVVWIGLEPLFRPLRSDPRFQAALRRLHLDAPPPATAARQ